MFFNISFAQEQNIEQPIISNIQQQIDEAQKEKELYAELEKIALSKKAILNTKYQTETKKGFDGEITNETGTGYFSEILSYEIMYKLSNEIVDVLISDPKVKNIVILNEENIQNQIALWDVLNFKICYINNNIAKILTNKDYDISDCEYSPVIETECKELIIQNQDIIKQDKICQNEIQYMKCLIDYPNDNKRDECISKIKLDRVPDVKSLTGGGIAAATLILGTISDISSFFKSDFNIKTRSITPNEKALTSLMANRIKEKKKNVILPNLTIKSKGKLYSKINKLIQNKISLESHLADQESMNSVKIATLDIQLIKIKMVIAILEKKISAFIESSKEIGSSENLKKLKSYEDIYLQKLKALAEKLSEKNSLIGNTTKLKNLIRNIESLIDHIFSHEEGKVSPMEAIRLVDHLKNNELSLKNTRLLYTSIISQAGEIETSKGKFTQGKISYIGGVILNFIITDIDGDYVNSNIKMGLKAKSYKRSKGQDFDCSRPISDCVLEKKKINRN
jgi:hypothetical protein